MRLTVVIICLLSALDHVWSANILALLPLPGKSHFIYTNAVLTALAARGHHVTLVSPFTPSKPAANMKYIEIHTKHEEVMKNSWTFDKFKDFVTYKSYVGFHAPVIWYLSYSICEEVLNHKQIKDIVASKDKYDLLVAEALFGQESLLVIGHLLNIPTINLNGFGPWSVINHVHGNDLQISSYPDPVSFGFTNQMSFEERFRNLMSTVITLAFYYNDHLPKHQEMIQRAFNDPKIPPLRDIVANISLTMANFHPAVGYPQTVTGNIIPIGGVHISTELPPIPKDIQEFLDRGKNSVIYFSLGSVVPVHLMPPEMLQIFVKAFSKLPYRVLWKIEADSVPNLPDNVKISKWLPQQSILAHPNVVLFITHGGLLSQHEAIYAGVPVVGIPFFGDQAFNVRLYEELGIGVSADFSTLTEQSFSDAILSVVGKPRFVENAKKVSAVFKHRPMSPSDTVVY